MTRRSPSQVTAGRSKSSPAARTSSPADVEVVAVEIELPGVDLIREGHQTPVRAEPGAKRGGHEALEVVAVGADAPGEGGEGPAQSQGRSRSGRPRSGVRPLHPGGDRPLVSSEPAP